MTTDTALALLRDAAGNLYMAYNAFTRNDAIAWEPLKETADRITALLDSGIKDAGDDVVEPDIVQAYRRGYGYDRVLNYIDSLQSALQVAQQERDAERERGYQWETTATNLLERAEKAEEALKVAQQERDDAVTQLKKWKEDGEHLFCQTCDSCGTDECCPPSQCWQTRAEKTEASNKRLVELLRAAEPDVSEIYERMQAEGWHRKERMEFQTKLIADIAELLRAAGK
jgi:hypothetical protein